MKILVGWSDSPGASAAVAWAKDLVARHGGEVRLAHAVSTFPIATYEGVTEVARMFDAAINAQTERANLVCKSLEDSGVKASCSVHHAIPGDFILGEAERWGADLIVVGRREIGRFGHLLLGSNSAHIVRRAKCPTLVVHDLPPTDHTLRVLDAVDGSASSARAVACAKSLWPKAETEALSVVEEGALPSAEAMHAAGDVPLKSAVGSPLEVLGTRAKEGAQDVTVVGRRGLGFFKELLLGSVSERIVSLAKASVLVVP